MKIRLLILVVFLFLLQVLHAQTPQLKTNWWQPNANRVNAVAEDTVRKVVYIGGEFNHIETPEPFGSVVDLVAGVPDFSLPNPDARVQTSAPDGRGGWFIGGDFYMVGDSVRYGIAHVDSLGRATSWKAFPSSDVSNIIVDGNSVYITGAFTEVNGVPRYHIAKLDARTGALITSWNPQPGNVIYTMSLKGNRLYLGGPFQQMNGQTRKYLAAVDTSTGALLPWNPDADGYVFNMALYGNRVYVSGWFSTIGGQARNYVAAIDEDSGVPTSWNPNPSYYVNAIAAGNGKVYLGGEFHTFNGTAVRNNIAEFDTASSVPTSWEPSVNYAVRKLLLHSGKLYFSGDFSIVNGKYRSGIASIDVATAMLSDWDPNSDSRIFTMSISGNKMYAGGEFKSIGRVRRSYLAAIDMITGKPTAWNPAVDDYVYNIAYADNRVYITGLFDTVQGQRRWLIAALDAATGAVLPWYPNPNDMVNVVIAKGNRVYLGGAFTQIGSFTRHRVAIVDTAGSGTPKSWSFTGITTQANITSMCLVGKNLYVGGYPAVGAPSFHTAAIDTATGRRINWGPAPPVFSFHAIYAMAERGTDIIIGGNFDSLGGQARRMGGIADTIGMGTVKSWNPNANNIIKDIAHAGNTVFASGTFTQIGGQNRKGLASVNISTGLADSWDPNPNNPVIDVYVGANTLYVSGMFDSIAGQSRKYFAAFDISAMLPVTFVTFNGETAGQYNRIQWSTAAELNNDYFTIERSQDGKSFDALARIDGAGNSSVLRKYAYIDQEPLPVSYYRLKQTDLNGSCSYSQIIRIGRDSGKNKLVLQPNPAGDVVELAAAKGKKYELIDLLGITQRKGVVGADGRILLDGLRPGAYVILVTMETGTEKLRLIRE